MALEIDFLLHPHPVRAVARKDFVSERSEFLPLTGRCGKEVACSNGVARMEANTANELVRVLWMPVDVFHCSPASVCPLYGLADRTHPENAVEMLGDCEPDV